MVLSWPIWHEAISTRLSNSRITTMCRQTSSIDSVYQRLTDRLEIVGSSMLSDNDKTLVREALVMRLCLLNDLTAGSPTAANAADTWRRTILGLTTLDVESYSGDWTTLREILTSRRVRELYPDVTACRRAFKQLAGGLIHYKWILSITLMVIDGEGWFERANQWIVFDQKINLKSLNLTTKACQDYLEFERSIPQRGGWRGPDGKGTRLLNIAKRAAADMIGDFDIRQYPFRPKHGNGATAELRRSESDSWHKNRHFAVDGDVINYMRWRVPESDWRSWFYIPYRGLDRCATLVCVPKSLTKNRTISKEPTTLQWLQQDVFAALDDYFAEHLAWCINLHDQTRSRELARLGSTDGSYATIDLSSASDSVTLDLVESLFDGLQVAYPLIATRSRYVLVESKDGEIHERIETQKFAPMGSAACFPTECIVFAVLAETAVRYASGRRSHYGDYVIYGDDIVIRSAYAADLVDILSFFGFDVNMLKTFTDTRQSSDGPAIFREACGIECLNGQNITPLRLSRRLVSLHMNESNRKAGEGVGLIDLVNRAYLFRYTTLRRWLVSVLSGYKWFRTCQYLAYSDYCEFAAAIGQGRIPAVRVSAPFIITDDGVDTNYRAFGARHRMAYESIMSEVQPDPSTDPKGYRRHKHDQGQLALQQPEARVTVAVAKKATPPAVVRSTRSPVRLRDLSGSAAVHDANDYFTYCCRTVSRTSVESIYELDAQGIVTLRPPDLKWSQKWVVVSRRPYLRRR